MDYYTRPVTLVLRAPPQAAAGTHADTSRKFVATAARVLHLQPLAGNNTLERSRILTTEYPPLHSRLPVDSGISPYTVVQYYTGYFTTLVWIQAF